MNVAPGSLGGQTVVLTGKVLGLGRGDMHRLIVAAGGVASDKVDRSTTVLVIQNGANGNKTTKFDKANKLGIPIISDNTFRDVIEGRLSIRTAIASHTVGTASAPVNAAATTPAPRPPKVNKREARQRAATVQQLQRLSDESSSGPYGIGF